MIKSKAVIAISFYCYLGSSFATFANPQKSEKGSSSTDILSSMLTKCYGKYGCYKLLYPFWNSHRVINMFPRPPEQVRPDFLLYTRKNTKHPTLLYENEHLSVMGSNYDSNK